MANEKRRLLYMFYLLATKQTNQGHIRSFELAESVGVTTRTVKSDIKELADFAKASGCTLHSKKGIGYWLTIDQPEVFEPVKYQLEIYFSSRGQAYHSESRVLDIIRRIITENEYLSEEEIAQSMYLTKSTLKKDMQNVRLILQWFGMRKKKINEEGPLILGAERARRAVMMYAMEDFFHDAQSIFERYDYSNWMDYDTTKRLDIRHKFLKILRESNVMVVDTHAQRLSRYLCLSINRLTAGYEVEPLEPHKRVYIEKLEQLEVAKKVYRMLEKDYGVPYSSQEAEWFAAMLVVRTDIWCYEDWQLAYPAIAEISFEMARKFGNLVHDKYNIPMEDKGASINNLAAAIVPTVYMAIFGSASMDILSLRNSEIFREPDPLARVMTLEFKKVYRDYFQIEITEFMMMPIVIAVRLYCMSIPYPIKPVRLAVVDSTGVNAAQRMSEMLRMSFGKMIEKTIPMELYELRRLQHDDIDAVIMGAPGYSYNYDWPYLQIPSILTTQHVNSIYESLILQNVPVEQMVDRLNISEVHAYEGFDTDSVENFNHMLAFKLGRNSAESKEILTELNDQSKFTVVNKTMFYYLPMKYIRQNMMEIYQLKIPFHINDEVCTNVVVMSQDFGKHSENLRIIHDFSLLIALDNKYAKDIFEHPTVETMVKMVRNGIKTLLISLD